MYCFLPLLPVFYILGSITYLAPHVAAQNVSSNSTGDWTSAIEKATAFVKQLNLTEKAQMVTGNLQGPCSGNISPIPRLNFSGLCLQDGPLAIRIADLASVFPAGVSVAASWDKNLAYIRGHALGEEFRGKGAHAMLGPVAGPLGRHPLGGRNWEGFSPDPYLTGIAIASTIEGLQDAGVQAVAKHYIGNEQETQRSNTVIDGKDVEGISSNMGDRTLHELYLWPFANSVKAGVASLMCSYNRLNETYACENSRVLREVLKNELGFKGYVMSDWFATHSGVKSIQAGLDMTMPGPADIAAAESAGLGGIEGAGDLPSFFGGNITMAVNNGTLQESRVDDMVIRIMTPYYYLKQDSAYPTVDPTEIYMVMYNYGLLQNTIGVPPARDVRGNHASLIRSMGAAGTVLLKNTNSTLPLKGVKNIGVFGNDAPDVANGLYFEPDVIGLTSSPDPEFGTLFTGGGSGAGRASYVISPLAAIMRKGQEIGSRVQYVTENKLLASGQSPSVFPTPDVCIVFLKTWARESVDRLSFENDYNSTRVVENVAFHCPNTVVVTHSAGVNTMPWAENPNVTAILAAHYPGQETGNSIVDILWGDVNPSGYLPYTIPRNESDYNVPIFNITGTPEASDSSAWQSNFTEGLMIDYRMFDAKNITPLYEFGYGLSYTTFELSSNITTNKVSRNITSLAPATRTQPGGNPNLWKPVLTVKASVKNTGAVAGATVPQLYVSLPIGSHGGAPEGTPKKVLRGFEKVFLQPGEERDVQFSIARRDVSFWSVSEQDWRIPVGSIAISVGLSSRDIKARAESVLVSS